MKRICPYCKRAYRTTGESFEQNPFCGKCLNERLAKAAESGPKLVGWRHEGRYMVPIWEDPERKEPGE